MIKTVQHVVSSELTIELKNLVGITLFRKSNLLAGCNKSWANHLIFFSLYSQLYDLMTMAFKYQVNIHLYMFFFNPSWSFVISLGFINFYPFLHQVSLCLRPSDVLLVTYNHMDAIRSFACDNPAISNQVENVYKLLHEVMVVIYLICKIPYSCGL